MARIPEGILPDDAEVPGEGRERGTSTTAVRDADQTSDAPHHSSQAFFPASPVAPGHAADADPADVNPADVNPADADSADADPADVHLTLDSTDGPHTSQPANCQHVPGERRVVQLV